MVRLRESKSKSSDYGMKAELASTDWRYRMVASSNNLFWALQLAGWFGLSVLTYLSLSLPYSQFEVSYLAHNVAQSALGLLLTVPLRYLYRWIWFWPVWRRVLLAVLLALAFAVLWAAARLLLFMAMTSESGLWSDFGGWLFPSIFVFVTWAALYHGIKYYQLLQRQREMLLEVEAKQRREALNLMELKSLARDAELRLLRYQLNPHFLFNTLNSVTSLIASNRLADANQMLLKLSSFLRFSLENDGSQFVSLEEECKALRLYLGIEEVRFADRLQVEINVEPRVEKFGVPSFFLQPLVENSIKHAINKNEEGGKIKVTASLVDDLVSLFVEDSGSGNASIDTEINCTEKAGAGVGLRNSRERLKGLYGARACLSTSQSQLGGLKVSISFPVVEVAAGG